MIRVNIDSFVQTYLSSIPEDLFVDMLNKSIEGEDWYFLPQSVYDSILANREISKQKGLL